MSPIDNYGRGNPPPWGGFGSLGGQPEIPERRRKPRATVIEWHCITTKRRVAGQRTTERATSTHLKQPPGSGVLAITLAGHSPFPCGARVHGSSHMPTPSPTFNGSGARASRPFGKDATAMARLSGEADRQQYGSLQGNAVVSPLGSVKSCRCLAANRLACLCHPTQRASADVWALTKDFQGTLLTYCRSFSGFHWQEG